MKFSALPPLAVVTALAIAAPAAAEPFKGPYVGAQAGMVHNKVGTIDADVGSVTINDSKDAFTAGIFAGYNIQPIERIVVSPEAGFNIGTSDAMSLKGATTIGAINPRYAFDLGLRAGYLIDDSSLIYARGGYENLNATVHALDGKVPVRDRDTFDGWSIGGGYERVITGGISARVEYRYSDLGGSDGKFDRHQALLGVAYNF